MKEPRFKVGDKIICKVDKNYTYEATIRKVTSTIYMYDDGWSWDWIEFIDKKARLKDD